MTGWLKGRGLFGSRFAGAAVPSERTAGEGMLPAPDPVWRLKRRSEDCLVSLKASGTDGLLLRKVKKNGVASPLKGKLVLSVVLPIKFCSARLGGAGIGSKSELVNGSFCRLVGTIRREFVALLLFRLATGRVPLASRVPFLNLISSRKFGWSGSLGKLTA